MRKSCALRLLLPGVQHRRADTEHPGLVSETAGDRNARAALMFQLIVASGQLTLSGLGTAPLCLGMNVYSYTYRLKCAHNWGIFWCARNCGFFSTLPEGRRTTGNNQPHVRESLPPPLSRLALKVG
jgi:hypothetical protein